MKRNFIIIYFLDKSLEIKEFPMTDEYFKECNNLIVEIANNKNVLYWKLISGIDHTDCVNTSILIE